MAKSEGTGSAADAGTETGTSDEEDMEAILAAQAETLMNEAEAGVKSAKAKVERQQEHLDGAELALRYAEADLAALKEGK